MRKYNRELPLFFLHVPKCGGTSLGFVLNKWFGDKYYIHQYDYEKKLPPSKVTLYKPDGSFIPDICIRGHFHSPSVSLKKYYPEAEQFITFFRDPLQVAISGFKYKHQEKAKETAWGKRLTNLPDDLDEYLLQQARNNRTNYWLPIKLKKNNYKRILTEEFIHVGLIERYQDSLNILAERLNKEVIKVPNLNRSPSHREPSEKVVKIFKKRRELDYRIFDLAMELNSR